MSKISKRNVQKKSGMVSHFFQPKMGSHTQIFFIFGFADYTCQLPTNPLQRTTRIPRENHKNKPHAKEIFKGLAQ